MNGLDAVVATLAVVAAVGGFRLGFVTRVASWGGLLLGVLVGSASLPWVVDRFADGVARSDLVLISAGIVVATGLVGQALGLLVGSRLHLAIPEGPARKVDRAVGAVAGVVGVTLFVWLVTPAMADVPEWPARQARGSEVVATLDRWLPDPPDTTQALRRLLGDRYPQVFDAFEAAPDLGPPPEASGLDEATSDRVARSTVKVSSEACDQVQEGSGFVVGPDLVATNAHVVAGARRTVVETTDGTQVEADLVVFDPERDLTLLSAPGLDRPALPLADADLGDTGAVFGHPGGAPLRLAPYTVGRSVEATGSDIYDRPGVRRQVLVLAAELHPGDSGSALVDPAGEVVGVAFAIAPDRPTVAYALDVAELRAVLERPRATETAAGDCIA